MAHKLKIVDFFFQYFICLISLCFFRSFVVHAVVITKITYIIPFWFVFFFHFAQYLPENGISNFSVYPNNCSTFNVRALCWCVHNFFWFARCTFCRISDFWVDSTLSGWSNAICAHLHLIRVWIAKCQWCRGSMFRLSRHHHLRVWTTFTILTNDQRSMRHSVEANERPWNNKNHRMTWIFTFRTICTSNGMGRARRWNFMLNDIINAFCPQITHVWRRSRSLPSHLDRTNFALHRKNEITFFSTMRPYSSAAVRGVHDSWVNARVCSIPML